MKRVTAAFGVVLVMSAHSAVFAQSPDFTGTWRFNQAKSSPNIAGNTPVVPFPSQLVVKQSATDVSIDSTSVRQQPVSAVFKLDGSKITVQAPSGITETGEGRFQGANLVITTRRSFSSPAGETVVEFREVWTLNGNSLSIVKTRTLDGDASTETAVFDKM
ncbi:MAG: hypothetical protein HOP16_03740 [Acidobacteria bacterium]|nr:hypothetical protein [Acidobacteriota bacterium]